MAQFTTEQQAEINRLAKAAAAELMGIPFNKETGKTYREEQSQAVLDRLVTGK